MLKIKILSLLSIVLMVFFFNTCSKVSDKELRDARNAVENGALIIDVRSREEFKEGHAKDSVNIPVQLIEKYYKHIPKNKEIVVYCRTGSRSSYATTFLRSKGRTVYDMVNQEEWQRELKSK